MKLFTAVENPEFVKTNEVACFLAGGITNCAEWQDAVIKCIEESNEDTEKLLIFNPRRKNFPIHDPNASKEQIEWEFKYLDGCDIFSMYFCAGDSDQPICMYELGRNICRIQQRFPNDWKDRIIISAESGYKRFQDVIIQSGLAGVDNVIVDGGYDKHAETIVNAYKNTLSILDTPVEQ